MSKPERDAITSGLGFASLMRRHFPEFFTQHVAARRTSYSELLGVVGAFLGLAHQRLIALDSHAVRPIPFVPSDPLGAFNHYLAGWTAQNYLADSGMAWLREPTPRVYGLALATVVPEQGIYGANGGPRPVTIEQHSLVLLLWRLVATTPWSAMTDTGVSEVAMARVGKLDLARAIASTRTLPRTTPLRSLCARLDQEKPEGIGRLGTILAFACRRSGNPFADHTADEMRYHPLIELDWRWSAARFAELRQDQEAAAYWSSTYSRLASRLWKDPALAITIARAIEATARAVLPLGAADVVDGAVYDPRHLINHFENQAVLT